MEAWTRIALLVFFILLVSGAHYGTDIELHHYHEVFQRLYYIPIFAAALWFGLKGGLGASILCSVLYIPHIVFQWEILPGMELEKYLEIVMFNVVGAVTGILAEKVRSRTDLYRQTAEKLDAAYQELQKSSTEMLRIERRMHHLEKNAALGEMSATVAHEFMNPLGSIKGAVEILGDEFPKGHEKRSFLDILVKEIDRLDRTVRSVLKFGRMERLTRSTCNPNDLLVSILVLIAGEARQRNIRVEQRLFPEIRTLSLDPDRVQQAFLNVVMNAIHAMPDGGCLNVSSAWGVYPERMEGAHETDERGREIRSGVLFSFEDSGCGIPEETMDRIFDSFFTTREEGTGLGLPIVKKIMEAHQGKVRICSRPGGGARIDLWFPLSPDPVAPDPFVSAGL